MFLQRIFTASTLIILLNSCAVVKPKITKFVPDNQQLYDTIVKMDSLFFDAYNNCEKNLEYYGIFYAENIEFYHDQGGLMTSKQAIIDGTQKNVCGKVKRTLLKGSIEVYPIKDFGAIEIGFHSFTNNQEPTETVAKIGRFVIIWQLENTTWKIKRVVSLH